MSSLRRDLVERKLWMIVALLVVAVAAVPVFLLKGASADTTPTVPVPPSASPAGAQTSTTQNVDTKKKESPKVELARIARNPFASAVARSAVATVAACAVPVTSRAATRMPAAPAASAAWR